MANLRRALSVFGAAAPERQNIFTIDQLQRQALYVGGDFSYRGAIFYAANLAASSRIPGYALVNARLGAGIGDHLDVSVWARNLFNKGNFATLQPAAFNAGLVTGVIGDPRVVGATARIRY
jgi:iron complex outermembrane receptor protein